MSAPVYYKGFDHVNTVDTPVSVVKVTSTEEERKRIVSVLINKETNAGHLIAYIERESLFEGATYWKTADMTQIQPLEIPINRELDVGKTFELQLTNDGAGTHAEISGAIKYEIM